MEHPTKLLKNSKSKLLEGKKILVGITSSIGAIESPKLIRELIRHGSDIYVIGTEESKKIIGEHALQFASGNPVKYEITGNVEHVMYYNECDAFIIFPATANTISKVSLNVADNIINTTALMFMENKPIFIIPAMHQNMLKSISNHVEILKKKKNIFIINPKLEENKVKVPPYTDIVKEVINKIGNKLDRQVLILSGGTYEYIDKVRVITNLSSGKTGYYLSEGFSKLNCNVSVVYGKCSKEPPYYVKSYSVGTSEEMLKKSMEIGKNCDIIISCAAISDYIPEKIYNGKIKSDNEELTIKLKRNKKIIQELKNKFKDKLIVGFKAEYDISEDKLIDICLKKLKSYKIDIIVGNDLSKHYFGDDYNEVIVVFKSGSFKKLSGKKSEIMHNLSKIILNYYENEFKE